MGQQKKFLTSLIIVIIFAFSVLGCSKSSSTEQEGEESPTSTPTESGGMVVASVTPSQNSCQGLSGKLELQILVGPSEAVGLEPVTVGEIPFMVVDEGGNYVVEGGGQLESYSDVLTAAWGTYTVTFEGDTFVSGDCTSSGAGAQLNLVVDMIAEQNVEIVYEGVQLNYPWSGTHQLDVALPVEEGAMAQGEGWVLTLILN